ncbi:hypothetical protein KKF91_16560, partial [Myxococcota bacterium]|nr:hypothetical protein [Myxococcota bacterium]
MRWFSILLATLTLACSGEERTTPEQGSPETGCVGDKCDTSEDALSDFIGALEVTGLSQEADEAQSLTLIASVAEAYYGQPADGHTLDVELFDVGSPDFRVKAKLTYYIDGVGAYMSAPIDTSDLLPWTNLGVRVFGTLGEQKIDQTLTLAAADLPLPATPIELIGALDFTQYTSAEGEQESFMLIASVAEAYYGQPADGHTLQVAFADAAHPDFEIKATLTYYEDGLGAYSTEVVDTSLLLPWSALKVTITGALGEQVVEQVFILQPSQVREESITPLSGLEVSQYTSSEGEQESFVLIASVAEAYYGQPADGHTLQVALSDAAHPGFEITATLTYYEDGLGAYATDLIDTSLLLPWSALKVVITGDLNGEVVEQVFTLTAADIFGIELLDRLEVSQYTSAEGEQESFMLIASVAEAYYGQPADGHTLDVAISDAAHPGFAVYATLTYYEDGLGAYGT